MSGQDIVYHNSGTERAEAIAADVYRDPNKALGALQREMQSGTATEQRAMWNKIIQGAGSGTSAESHLPPGFTITGADGHHIVKDHGRVIYDEAKVEKQAQRDAQIHNGEGPYQSFRRQGMTHEEAMAASKDYLATLNGDKVVRSGDTTHADPDGKGSWHRFDHARADAQGQAYVEARAKQLDQEQQMVNQNFGNFSHGGLFSAAHMSKDDINGELHNPMRGDPPAQQKQFLEYLQSHYDEMKGSNGLITADSIKAYFDKQRQQNFV